MDPITASILLSAGTNLAGFGLKRFLGSERPEYEIPNSARQALGLARIQAADKNMPGEQKAIERAGVSSANAVRAAQESGNVLESISGIQGQYDAATQGILARSEADQKNDQQRLAQQLGQMAQYEDMRYQMNEYAPYAEKQQETRDLVGALSTNLSSAMLHQGLNSQTMARGVDDETLEGVQPASEEVGEYTRQPTPSLLEQKPMAPIVSDGGRLAQLPYSVKTNAESGAEDYDQIRLLLNLLEKQPTTYPYY